MLPPLTPLSGSVCSGRFRDLVRGSDPTCRGLRRVAQDRDVGVDRQQCVPPPSAISTGCTTRGRHQNDVGRNLHYLGDRGDLGRAHQGLRGFGQRPRCAPSAVRHARSSATATVRGDVLHAGWLMPAATIWAGRHGLYVLWGLRDGPRPSLPASLNGVEDASSPSMAGSPVGAAP